MRESEFRTGRNRFPCSDGSSIGDSLSNVESVGHQKWGRLSDPSKEQ